MTLTRREFLKWGSTAVVLLAVSERVTAGVVTIPVLMYHDVSYQTRELETVSPPDFAAQMEWLYSAGYRAVSFDQLPTLDEEIARRVVLITFDDGYASFMDIAGPLLREYGFHATINIVGKHVGGFVSGQDPRLSWDECRMLVTGGLVEIGCHSYGLHRWYGNIPRTGAIAALNERLAQDLMTFQEVYSKEMGRSATVLAWPYGMHDSRSIEIAKQAGFHYILSSESGYLFRGGNHDGIPRLTITKDTDLRQFREIIEARR
jgi:peptidoglycan/xylan/chitin deacetylase (PgdA/CDA1 family)